MKKQFLFFLTWKLTEENSPLVPSDSVSGQGHAPSWQQQGHWQTHIPALYPEVLMKICPLLFCCLPD